MDQSAGEEDYYCISLFQDQLKASGFWWIVNDDKNNNFVPDTLQNALYISAHLVLTLFTEQAFSSYCYNSPISLIEETEAQASNFKRLYSYKW